MEIEVSSLKNRVVAKTKRVERLHREIGDIEGWIKVLKTERRIRSSRGLHPLRLGRLHHMNYL
ncbi:MAG: hypothetical protein DRN53_07715 [Thermoprotei archaeon]|nr:MAG: hypothetical protein DRN53_07715 [Thermoprotei archaeon]